MRRGLQTFFLCAAVAVVGLWASRSPRPAAVSGMPRFVDRAKEFGLDVVTRSGSPEKRFILESLGTGVALFDFDGDSDLDLFVCGGSEVKEGRVVAAGGPRLFRNDGPGRWEDITARSGLHWTGWAQGPAVGDYDGDGDLDLFIAQNGPDTLWRNEGNGTFVDVTAQAGLGRDGLWGVSATWGDVDGDGFIDLYVTNYVEVDPLNPPPLDTSIPGAATFLGPASLKGERDVLWRNRGDGTFEDATHSLGLESGTGKGMSALLADLDGDGRSDLFVTNDTEPNELFHNTNRGRFIEEAFSAGVAFDPDGNPRGSMGIDLADFDGDGRLDLVFSNFRGDGTSLYRNRGNRTYEEISRSSGMFAPTAPMVGWGIVAGDFDEDGRPDLFQANGHVFPVSANYAQAPLLLRNENGLRFRDATADWGAGLDTLRSGRAVASGDLDGDGDLDLVMTTIDGPLRVLVNDAESGNHAVSIRIKDNGPNMEGLGSRVEIRAGGVVRSNVFRRGGSILAASDSALHFGLGQARGIERLKIQRPDGSTQIFNDLPVDAEIVVRRGEAKPTVIFHRPRGRAAR